MPEQNDSSIQSQGASWRLSFGAVRVHNSHLQSGRGSAPGCSVCSQGLVGLMAEDAPREKPSDENEVDKSDRTDEKEDSTSPPDPWVDWRR